MESADLVPLDSDPTPSPTVRKKQYLSFKCVRKKIRSFLFISAFVLVFLTILVLIIEILGAARSNASRKDPNKASPTASTAPTTPGQEAWWKVRLPRDVVPSHYNVFLNVTVDLPHFDGNVEIEVDVKSPTDTILVHSRGLNISHVKVVDKMSKDQPIRRQFMFSKNDFYVIQTKSMLSAGQYVVSMRFKGFYRKDLRGLYRSAFKTPDGKLSNFASTQFQPVRARTAFPCLDEPALKATFNVTIAHRPDYIALSNMPIYRSEAIKGETHDYFKKTVVMPTYLLALAVGDFRFKKVTTKNNVEMRIYSRPSVLEQANFAAIDGSKILTFFEEYFDVKYPLPKADMIGLSDFGPGAMENWGLIIYKERYLLWEKTVSSEANKVSVSDIISHELAHQWFGNIVTMKWWDDLWLNEGFASYLSGKGVAIVHPSWEMEDRKIFRALFRAIPLDGRVTSHPIKVDVNHPNEIGQIFDAISYNKGAAVLAMLESFLGSSIFRDGLKRYVTNFSYGNAETDDLWQVMKEASCAQGSCIDVKEVMDTWTLQMGYPVIKLTKQSSSTYQVTQRHFLFDKTTNISQSKYSSPFNYKWEVPFTFVSSNEQGNRVYWMKKGSIVVTDDGKWIKGNRGQKGFYVVNYEDSNWKALKDQLNADLTALNTSDRAGLIFDAFVLASGGEIAYSTAFDMTTYMKKEKDLIPWDVLMNRVKYLTSMLPHTSSAYKRLQKYLVYQGKELYDELGFKDSGHHLDIFKRRLMLSLFCDAGVSSCVQNATERFSHWKSNPDQRIPPNLREIVLTYGVAYGEAKDWDFVYEQYLKSDIPDEQQTMLKALAASRETWILARYLEYTLDSKKVSKDKVRIVISSIAENPVGKRVAWDFIRLNWDQYKASFGSELLVYRRLVPLIATHFNTDYELKELEDLTKSFTKRTGINIAVMQQITEEVKSNMNWLTKNKDIIDNWLTKYMADKNIQ